MSMTDAGALRERFERRFAREATVLADAGGRVNLIGEHTDYHDGFVLPAAIDLRTLAWGAPRGDRVLRIHSEAVGQTVEVSIDGLEPFSSVDWCSYVVGPLWALERSGWRFPGADVLVASDVPFGGGLSSSASVEVGLVGLAAGLMGISMAPREAARIARKAENEFCHVPCGAMDQVASACGQEAHALLIDCRTLETTAVAMPSDWAIVVADSGVRHSLAAGEYAKRQRECASGLAKLREVHPELKAARDLTIDVLEEARGRLTDVEHRRLKHVVQENARVLEATGAMERGDAAQMGRLLQGSHASLAADYEVSCPELDALVDLALGIPGVWGARLTGAGFGGNTMNLVPSNRADEIAMALADRQEARTGRRTAVRVVRASRGLVVTLA